MKTLKTILAVLTIMMALPTTAQTTLVKGILLDSLTQQTEPYATIRVYKKGDTKKPVAMSVSDLDGHIRQEVSGKGHFVMAVSSVGKQVRNIDFSLSGQPSLDLGTILLQDDDKTLGAIEVVAQKPLVKMETDKMTYNVAEDEDSKTNTVLDMLRKVPMVTVDGQDNITVNGQSSFKVYVDGKPNAMFSQNASMIFKNMPATAVKNIEVITNPGAAYDAEGTGGVLNIVMNKNPQAQASMNGYNATIRGMVGTKSLGGGGFVNGQQGRFSYSANVMYNYGKPGESDVTMKQEQLGATPSTILTTSKTDTKTPFLMGSLNMGYELDSMSSMNVMLSLTQFNLKNPANSVTAMTGGIYNSSTGFGYTNDLTMRNKRTSFNGSIDYQRFFNAERTSSMAITYQLSASPSHNEQWSNFSPNGQVPVPSMFDLTNRYSDNNEHTTEHVLQTDFTTSTLQQEASTKLNFGAKLTARLSNSDAKYYLNDIYTESLSSDYHHDNTIAAAYTEYDGHFGKVGLKTGLRYEHTWQSVEYKLGNGLDFKKNYGNLVPSASLSYTLTQTSNIGLTYNMRISRPGISYLNPYIDRSNPTALSYGNTDLDVEKSHTVGLVYNMYSPKLMLNVKLSHAICDNAIEQYNFYEDNLLHTTYGNIVKRNLSSLNVYGSWMPAKNTRIFMNGGVNYTDLRSDELDARNSGWSANAMAGIQQTLPASLKLSLFAITSTKSYTLQGWSSGFNLLTGSLSRSFLNDKLTVGVQGIVGLSSGGRLEIESFSRGRNFTNSMLIRVPISSVSLNVSFTFGNTKKQMKQFQSRVQSDYMEHQSNEERITNVGME